MPNSEISDFYTSQYQIQLEAFENLPSEDRERRAQLEAIHATFEYFYEESLDDPAELWRSVRVGHVRRKANIEFELTDSQISAVISADQSWKKSSGHAAESFFAQRVSRSLETNGLKLVLQKELSVLLRENRVLNPDRDVATLGEWIASSAFDLFVAIRSPKSDGFTVFGCCQSKTSIRDRVTRDREPSTQAMDKFFWSVALVIDGDFLRLPKFQHMVDGGVALYPTPGWHGLYALSSPYTSDRVFSLAKDMQPFVRHAVAAASQFQNNRQWLTSDWSA